MSAEEGQLKKVIADADAVVIIAEDRKDNVILLPEFLPSVATRDLE